MLMPLGYNSYVDFRTSAEKYRNMHDIVFAAAILLYNFPTWLILRDLYPGSVYLKDIYLVLAVAVCVFAIAVVMASTLSRLRQ
jgi:hypothetical protein